MLDKMQIEELSPSDEQLEHEQQMRQSVLVDANDLTLEDMVQDISQILGQATERAKNA